MIDSLLELLCIVSKRKYLKYKVSISKLDVRKGSDVLFCPLQGVIEIVSKKWALLTINEIGNHKWIRFGELKNELRGITAKTLSKTLDDLRDNGLIIRKTFNEVPPRVEYSLTEDGFKLHKMIIPLLQWASTRKGAVVSECSCRMIRKE